MTVSTRCPNRSCGCVSQLVDDPLGRIFRCPRCLTKLPTAPAAAADSGWTAVMRPTLRGRLERRADGGLRTNRADARARRNLAGVATIGRDGHPLGFESGEMAIGVAYREFDDERQRTAPGSDPGLGFDESGEMIAEPFSRSGSLVSAWSSPSRSRASVASGSGSAPSAAAAIGSDEGGQFGRFRVLGVLGQGQHATVYRACDTILDRDVALKVPRRGVLADGQVAGAVPGRGAVQRGCDIPGSCRSTRRAGPASSTTSQWPSSRVVAWPNAWMMARCRSDGPSRSSSSWPRRWPMPTPRGSCTAMSSRPTSGSDHAAMST